MTFFATKSRITTTRFPRIAGDGSGSPDFDGAYWYLTFREAPNSGRGGPDLYPEKISFDNENNIYYFFHNSSFLKLGSIDTSNFTSRFNLVTDYDGNETAYIDIGNYRKSSSNNSLYVVGSKWDYGLFTNELGSFYFTFVRDIAFISKFDKNGNSVWEKRDTNINNEAGEGNNFSYYEDVAIDSNGNAFCVGQYGYLVVFDPWQTTSGLLFAKYSPSGSLLYQASYEAPSDTIYGGSVVSEFDSTNHCYVAISHLTDFPTERIDYIICKINTNGTIVWKKAINAPYTIGRPTVSKINTIAIHGNVYGPGAPSGGYVSVISDNGNVLWTKSLEITPSSSTFDSEGNLYVLSLNNTFSPPSYTFDGFAVIFKFNQFGALVWQIKIRGTFIASNISCDENDDLYISGNHDDPNDDLYGIIKLPSGGNIITGSYFSGGQEIILDYSNYSVIPGSITLSDYNGLSTGTNTYSIEDTASYESSKSLPDSDLQVSQINTF